LYASAERGEVDVPWDRGGPNPLLVEWCATHAVDGRGLRAMVVGSGLGGDAEFIAALGFATTGFDLSETAIRTTRTRFPTTAVDYGTADLLALPSEWHGAVDFVLESLTVQSMPRSLRAAATAGVRSLVASGGRLLVISGALGADDDPEDGPPWRLTRAELDGFGADGLRAIEVEEISDPTGSGASRWRALFARA
jgi:hypothetical protein